MMLEGRKTLVWVTIAAAVGSAVWLSAADGSIPRLGPAPDAADARAKPSLLLKRGPPAPAATSHAR